MHPGTGRSLTASVVDRNIVLEELNRLLGAGEPLLTAFPNQYPNGFLLHLPDNTSDEMRLYANDVTLRARDRTEHNLIQQQLSTPELKKWAQSCEAGLSGWCHIGALPRVPVR